MKSLIFFVVCLVLAIAGRILSRWRSKRRRQGPPLERNALQQGVPTFRVVSLGLQGSGKTLLLASMYQRLQAPAGQSYFLTAPYDQVIQLNQWFSQVADTSRDWPSGTTVGEMREFTFDVRTRSVGELHTILRLSYVEYAGELLTERQTANLAIQEDLIKRVHTADALVGIIDGHRIRQHLDGRAEGHMHVQQTLTAMISPMIQASCPITFVITKWDLLADLHADENTRLHIVRNLLMNNPGFRELVTFHSAQRVVRLIPVSAVGPEFATIDADGMIVKRPQGHIEPTYVDVPLSAVVPDIFEQIEYSLDSRMRQAVAEEARRQARLSPAKALANLGAFMSQAAGKVVLGALSSHGAALMGQAAFGMFLDSRTEATVEQHTQFDRRLSEAEQKLHQFRLARRKVLREFQSKVDVLEGRLPSSRLSNGQLT